MSGVPPVRLPDDVLLHLLHHLPSSTLQRYARVNREIYTHYRSILPVLYDVDECLSVFFSNVRGFRRLQAHTGLLVSGSVALQFMGRVSYGPTDIDLYVEHTSALVVLDWLRLHGYGIVPRGDSSAPLEFDFWDMDVNRLAHRTGYYLRPGQILFKLRNAAGKKLDLIISVGTAVTSLLCFHSSIVMNFISHSCAVSLYALGTFTHGEMLLMRTDDPFRLQLVIDKYVERGFKVCEKPGESTAFVPGNRWIADTWHRDDLELVRGADLHRAIRKRSPWVLPLPAVDLEADQDSFWSNRSYDLHLFDSMVPRLGIAYWARLGWELRLEAGGAVMVSEEYSYDSDITYVVPDAFADYVMGRLFESSRSTSVARGRRLDIWIALFRLHDL